MRLTVQADRLLNLRERERETETERERESRLHHSPGERKRESVAILAQVLHLCWEACSASLHRGRGAGLP